MSPYHLRYSRWQDRLAARLPWTASQRRLRMAQALLDSPAGDPLRHRIDLAISDLALYGTSFSDSDGNRIDPETVRAA